MAGPAPIPITGISSFGISASVTADGIASKTIAKQPTDWSASASSVSLAAASAVRALGLEAAEGRGGLRSEADVTHHRDPGADDRAGAIDRGTAPLELDSVDRPP